MVGISIDVIAVPSNANSPILINVLGNTTDCKLLHFSNASLSI